MAKKTVKAVVKTKTIAVDFSEIGVEKPIEVIESVRNYSKAMDMQLMMVEMEEDAKKNAEIQKNNPNAETDVKASLSQYSDMLKSTTEFITGVAKLTDKQADALWDLDQETLLDIMMRIITGLMHLEEKTYEEEQPKEVGTGE